LPGEKAQKGVSLFLPGEKAQKRVFAGKQKQMKKKTNRFAMIHIKEEAVSD
jgi:hypothetical protein